MESTDRPKAVNKPGTRRRILDAALLEFSEHGLAGARVDRIAGLAGANKAMIYYHFKSKKELYGTVMSREMEKIARRVSDSIDEGVDLPDVLRSVAENYMMILPGENYFTSIIIREMASGGEEIQKAFKTVITERALPEKLIGMIEAGQNSGKYRKIDSRQAMISFLGMNLFYLIFSPLVNSIWEIDNEKDFRKARPVQVVDLFLHGLEAR